MDQILTGQRGDRTQSKAEKEGGIGHAQKGLCALWPGVRAHAPQRPGPGDVTGPCWGGQSPAGRGVGWGWGAPGGGGGAVGGGGGGGGGGSGCSVGDNGSRSEWPRFGRASITPESAQKQGDWEPRGV